MSPAATDAIAPPDYVGVGTHLAGTTWWHELLLEHPELSGPAGDERSLHFFEPFCTREMTAGDVAAYHALFPAAGASLRGEWTPRYLYDAWTPRLLARAAPRAKLLVLLCDPIERYRLSLGYRARDDDEESAAYMTDVIHRGRYASQLRALWRAFPAEQVLVLQLERCRADPLGQYRRTLRFLGADPSFVPRRYRRLARGKTGSRAVVRAARALGLPEHVSLAELRRRLRRSPPRVEPVELWPEVHRALQDSLAPEIRALEELVPELDRDLWPNFAGPGHAPGAEPVASRPRWRRRAVAGVVAAVSGGGLAVVLQLTDVI